MIHFTIGTNGANDQYRAMCGAKGTMTKTKLHSFVTCPKCAKLLIESGVKNVGSAYEEKENPAEQRLKNMDNAYWW